MIESGLLEYIECAIPHNCTRKSNSSQKCTHCAINYAFIVKQPVILTCEHQICFDCEDKSKNSRLNCKICESMNKNSRIQSTGAKNKLIDKIVNDNLTGLYAVLKTKFQDSRELFKERKVELEMSVVGKRQIIKNEIDLEIEHIHVELEKVRQKLFFDVDNYVETALQLVDSFFKI